MLYSEHCTRLHIIRSKITFVRLRLDSFCCVHVELLKLLQLARSSPLFFMGLSDQYLLFILFSCAYCCGKLTAQFQDLQEACMEIEHVRPVVHTYGVYASTWHFRHIGNCAGKRFNSPFIVCYTQTLHETTKLTSCMH